MNSYSTAIHDSKGRFSLLHYQLLAECSRVFFPGLSAPDRHCCGQTRVDSGSVRIGALCVSGRSFTLPGCVSELLGVPADDDRREQVEPRDPEVPGSGRPVPDPSAASDPQRVFQRMVRLTLVQAETGAQLDVDVVQPMDNGRRASPPCPLPALATLAATACKDFARPWS